MLSSATKLGGNLMEDPVSLLRMVERITAVVIAGFSIYFGYRLFFHLPFERTHGGQLELPGVKIVLSRVGPGVFFAAFGSMLLYHSITAEIKVSRVIHDSGKEELTIDGANSDITRTSEFIGISSTGKSGGIATPQQRSKALTTVEMLNCAHRLLIQQSTSPELQDKMSLAIRDAKRAMVLSVWNEDDWGPAEGLGVNGPTSDAPFQVRNIFTSTYKGCPK